MQPLKQDRASTTRRPAGIARAGYLGHEFLPRRSGADGSAAHSSAGSRCSATSSRISTGSARSPAVISTNARGSPTATHRCCTSATVSAATRSGSNIIRPIANWRRAAFGEFGIHAMSVRKGILGWPDKYPVVAKHAFTFLFNQAEFGWAARSTSPTAAPSCLSNFGSEALKAKYLDGLTADRHEQADPGRPVHDREGRRLRRRHADDDGGAGRRSLAAVRARSGSAPMPTRKS